MVASPCPGRRDGRFRIVGSPIQRRRRGPSRPIERRNGTMPFRSVWLGKKPRWRVSRRHQFLEVAHTFRHQNRPRSPSHFIARTADAAHSAARPIRSRRHRPVLSRCLVGRGALSLWKARGRSPWTFPERSGQSPRPLWQLLRIGSPASSHPPVPKQLFRGLATERADDDLDACRIKSHDQDLRPLDPDPLIHTP